MASMSAAYGVFARRQNPRGHAGWRIGVLPPWRAPLAWLAVLLWLAPAGMAEAAPVRLLILGDSLTAGYGLPHSDGFQARLKQALAALGRRVTIVDGSVSGDTSAGGRARLDWVLAGGADAAILELGANDGLRGLDPTEMEANLTAILDTLQARHVPVLLTGMLAPPNMGAAYGDAFRAVFTRLGRRPGVLFDPFFLDGVAAVPALNQPDGMHPNAAGVQRIVVRLLPLVEKLLSEVRTP